MVSLSVLAVPLVRRGRRAVSGGSSGFGQRLQECVWRFCAVEDGRKKGRERQRGRTGGTGDALAGAPGSRPRGEKHYSNYSSCVLIFIYTLYTDPKLYFH